MEGQMDGRMDRQRDVQTNGLDENYIPLWYTSYAMGIIRGCLYKQTAKYYFIGMSYILTSSPALGHDPGVHKCRMEENLPDTPVPKMKSFWSVAAEL